MVSKVLGFIPNTRGNMQPLSTSVVNVNVQQFFSLWNRHW